MTRKLATIQRIKELLPIKDADRIELAIINGWQVVTQKGQHKVGDLVVFYEIDSWLPSSDPRYASFSDRFTNWGDKHGMRLKTIKLKKQLSQGLIMPVKDFKELYQYYVAPGVDPKTMPNAEGADVTGILKIEKWEPLTGSPGEQVANTRVWPSFIRKTDQERIQNCGALAERAIDEDFEATIKKDGSSMTVFRVDPSSTYYAQAKALIGKPPTFWQIVKGFVFGVKEVAVYGICSRNVLLPLEGNSNFHKAAASVIRALENEGDFLKISYAVQGELVAPDIQGNYEKVKEPEFHVFDVFDIQNQSYLLPVARRSFAAINNLRHVTPVVLSGKLRDIVGFKEGDDIVKKLLTYASGPGDNPGVDREGVVFKSANRDFSFKAVSNEYLLKSGK